MRGAQIGGALAAAALTLALAPGASGQTLSFDVSQRPARETDSRRPAPAIARGFVGVSIDYCNITRYAQAGPNPILDQLLLALAPEGGVVRIGGDQLGQSCAGDPNPLATTPPVIGAVLRQTRSHAILGVDFVDGNPYLVPSEVSTLVHALDPRHPSSWIDAFEIGNEPDLYPRYGSQLSWQQTQPSFFSYLAAFAEWAGLVHRFARDPAVGVAGPSLGRLGIPWIHGPFTHDFRAFMSGPAQASPITFHEYPLLSQVPCPNAGCPAIVNLLSNSASHGLAQQVGPYSAWLADPQQVRVDEANSVTGGGVSGVSDTFASALWILDSLFEFARAGVGGVNVHTFPSAHYALFSGPQPGGWVVYPEYYGMLAFERAAPFGSQLLSVSSSNASATAPYVKVWAVQTLAGSLHVVAINKDLIPHTVVFRGPGVPYAKTATISVLRGPATPPSTTCPYPLELTGMCALAGVTLGGATFGPADQAGGDQTSTGALGRPAPHTCTLLEACTMQPRRGEIELTLAPGTATIIAGSAAPPPQPKPGHHGHRSPVRTAQALGFAADGPQAGTQEHPLRPDRRGDLLRHVRHHVRGCRDLRPRVSDVPQEAPPTGEEIHLPGPTLIPIVTAAAITLIVVGTTINWIFSALGGVILIVCIFRWIGDTRRDIAALPEEHGH